MTANIQPDESTPGKTHPRTIGWIGTTALAMGGSNQSLFLMAALFVGQGDIAGQGSAAVPLLMLGLLLSWAAAYGWTELIMMWPNRVGGISGACSEAFRPYNPVLSALTGVCYWWGWVPTCGLTALFSASAIQQWFLPDVPIAVMATAIVLLFLAVNLCGIKWVVRLATPIAFTSAGLAFISALAPVLTGRVDWVQASTFHLTVPFDGWFGSMTSLMAGLYLIGFAAPAFEAAACHVGETKDPNRNVPRAMLASALMAAVYFAILPVVWLGAIGPEAMSKDLALALGPTFAPVFGSAAKAAAIGFMMFNMFHGTIQPLAGAARTLSQLSEDGLLPRSLSLRSRTDAPWVATSLTAGMSILFLWIGDPIWLIAAANFTYLIGICMPSVAVWLLRRDAPDMLRPYRAPRGMVVAGLVAACAWMVSAILGFEQFGIDTVIIGLVMAYSGAALYAWRQFADRRGAGLPGFSKTLHVKLTGAMLTVLVLDGIGYYMAVKSLPVGDSALISALQDIFVAVAMLTISVGLVLPGMISHSVAEVSATAKRLVAGTLSDFTNAMEALGRGNLEAAHANIAVTMVPVRSRDEIGEMAQSFNALQEEVGRAAIGLGGARDGLSTARRELLDANRALEERVRERNRLVEELIEARDVAQAANLAKGNFLAKMSHEIRTPMNGVLTTTELLQRSELTASQQRLTEIISGSGNMLLSLIDQILDLSKLDSGKLELEPVDFDLVQLVVDTTTPFVQGAAQKPINFSTLLPDDKSGLLVNGDSLRLRQVLNNLISNALKFTHEGEVAVALKITGRNVGSISFEISVHDTGIGLHDRFKPRMFEAFTQANETATRIYGGTGLGLSIVKQIVDLMGGRIDVESELGKGSRFTVSFALPRAGRLDNQTDVPAPSKQDLPKLAPNTSGATRGKILVAEDNLVNQEVIAESLSTLDYDFAIVENGVEAVAAAQTGQFGLVLMDCRMPVMDGFDAARAIRKAERDRGDGSHIPIIALSANAMKGDREECLASGMDDHMAKPFKLGDLEAVLDRWISARGIGPAKTTPDSDLTIGRGPATAGFSTFDETPLAQISNLQRTGRQDLLARVVGTFCSATPGVVQQMRGALARGDLTVVRDLARGLKASSTSLGAVGFSEACRALERLAEEENQNAVQIALSELSDGFLTVKTKLELYAQNRGTESAGEQSNRAAG